MSNGNTEAMLTQLIKMVAENNSGITEMKHEIQGIKGEIQEIKTRQEKFEAISDQRHTEVMEHIRSIKIDQNFLWEKTVQHEREIEHLKKR